MHDAEMLVWHKCDSVHEENSKIKRARETLKVKFEMFWSGKGDWSVLLFYTILYNITK